MVGTLTRNGDNKDLSSVFRRYVDTYTGPASYVTGGDPVEAGDLALGRIIAIFFGLARNVSGTVYGLVYDATNGKIVWYVLDTGAEVANGTDLDGFSATFEAIGK